MGSEAQQNHLRGVSIHVSRITVVREARTKRDIINVRSIRQCKGEVNIHMSCIVVGGRVFSEYGYGLAHKLLYQ